MVIFELSTGQGIKLPLWSLILFVVMALGVAITFYVLRSIGIYKLAKNNGLNKAILAFIPGVWIYLACKLIGEARFFRTTIGKVAIVFTIIFSISTIGSLIYDAIIYTPIATYLIGGLNKGAVVVISNQQAITGYSEYLNGIFVLTSNFKFPFSSAFVLGLDIIHYFLGVLDAVATVISIFVYFALFRKFWPGYHVLASILSIFGLFAPFVFAIRNRQAVNFATYVRSRSENYNNYGNNTYNENKTKTKPDVDPFDNMGKDDSQNFNPKSDDPFDDFN